ncbi:MAG TPA: type VI secretion system baseplate subunit TssK [Chitinivibrionales bacterium]|nr:type VI secretion system baseplate subunit TssK [Chitinivibrionales bacterium]
MLTNSKVVWKEGMFLQPQHFQQEERHIFNAFHAALAAHSPHWYGVTELEIDNDAIANGLVSVTRCGGMLPDGVSFSVPKEDPAPPARAFGEHLTHEQQSLDVYVALPLAVEGKSNVVSAAMEGQAAARYRSRPLPVADEVLGSERKEIEVGALNFVILFGDESLDNHAAFQIAKLARNASGTVELSPLYVPPLLFIAASPHVLNLLKSLLEFLFAKINSLSQGRKHVEGGFAEFSGAEETPFRLLQTLNTYTPLLAHYHSFPSVHPYEVFCLLTQFAGSLCTFSSEVSIKNLPRYDHANLSATFGVLCKLIRSILEADIQAGCVPVPIEQINQATFLCKVPDEKLLSVAKFYFGVSAKAPEKELVVGVLQRIKMCSRNKLDLLISSAMPGLPLKHVMRPPQGLSTKPGFVYFSLEQSGDFWNQIKAAGNIAFYFPNNYAELKMEMLALKE